MSNWIKPRIDAARSLWANDSEEAVKRRLSLYDLNDKEKNEVLDTAKTINKIYDVAAHTLTTLAGAGMGGYAGHLINNNDTLATAIGTILGGGLGYFAYDPLQNLNRQYLYTGDPSNTGRLAGSLISNFLR